MPRTPINKLLPSSGYMNHDRRKESDRHRYRERSPVAGRHRDRSTERYTGRSTEGHRSARYREQSKSRTRNTDRYRSSSRNRRSPSKTRNRSRSRSPRRHHTKSSSRHYSSKSRSQRSRSTSSSSSKLSSRSRDRSKPRRDSLNDRKKEVSSNSQVHVYTSEELQQISNRTKMESNAASSAQSASNSLYQNSSSWKTSSNQSVDVHIAELYDDALAEPIDKERIHREMEEKLRLALAKEGKVYPPPKQEPSHPVFANDGSFLEIFKKMQQQMPQQQPQQHSIIETAEQKAKNQPICKRRGGKILKTGIVAKSRSQEQGGNVDPKDFWSIYLQEVKKYKNTSCDVDSKTRPLVK